MSMSSTVASPTGARRAGLAVTIARVLLSLSFAALAGAWVTQVTRAPLLGTDRRHLFGDAVVVALLGIGSFLDAFWHARAR